VKPDQGRTEEGRAAYADRKRSDACGLDAGAERGLLTAALHARKRRRLRRGRRRGDRCDNRASNIVESPGNRRVAQQACRRPSRRRGKTRQGSSRPRYGKDGRRVGPRPGAHGGAARARADDLTIWPSAGWTNSAERDNSARAVSVRTVGPLFRESGPRDRTKVQLTAGDGYDFNDATLTAMRGARTGNGYVWR